MLPATAAFVFFMYVTDQVMTQMHAEEQRARAGVAFDRAERIISDQRVPDWQGRLKEIKKTFRVEHEIVPFDKAFGDFFLSSSEKEQLKNGAIAFRDRPGGGTVYMRRIKDSDRVLRIEWVAAYEYLVVYHAIILALVTIAVCAILWRWTRPLWRDLQTLKAATARVGEGDFDVRAQVSSSSLLEPIATRFNAMAQRVPGALAQPPPAAGTAQVRPRARAHQRHGGGSRRALRRDGKGRRGPRRAGERAAGARQPARGAALQAQARARGTARGRGAAPRARGDARRGPHDRHRGAAQPARKLHLRCEISFAGAHQHPAQLGALRALESRRDGGARRLAHRDQRRRRRPPRAAPRAA